MYSVSKLKSTFLRIFFCGLVVSFVVTGEKLELRDSEFGSVYDRTREIICPYIHICLCEHGPL